MSIIKAIDNALTIAQERNWDRTYWAFDIHGTISKPSYQKGDTELNFYPYAEEVLQRLTKMNDVIMIMYTCSYPREIMEYDEKFKELGIVFDYTNENPEVSSTAYGYYKKKPYFNVLFEDKAGFDPETDWKKVLDYINERFI